MDSINPNSHAFPSRIQNLYAAQQHTAAKPSAHTPAQQMAPQAVTKVEKVETFSSMFGDTELERLQRNLESIASFAEKAMDRFSKGRN